MARIQGCSPESARACCFRTHGFVSVTGKRTEATALTEEESQNCIVRQNVDTRQGGIGLSRTGQYSPSRRGRRARSIATLVSRIVVPHDSVCSRAIGVFRGAVMENDRNEVDGDESRRKVYTSRRYLQHRDLHWSPTCGTSYVASHSDCAPHT